MKLLWLLCHSSHAHCLAAATTLAMVLSLARTSTTLAFSAVTAPPHHHHSYRTRKQSSSHLSMVAADVVANGELAKVKKSREVRAA